MMSMTTSYGERDYAYGAAMFTLRTTLGLTQEQLGNRLGISPRGIREWEAGNSYPKVEHLKALIALTLQNGAFTPGCEAEEIRALWKVAHQKMLLFSICQNGLYNVFGGPINLSNYSLAIHTGLGKPNTIAVEASGSRMIFYVNWQQIDQEQDSNPTSGGIGLIADPHYHSPTDVAFSNARVWTL
jgi:transcriptional regulator with XRE-family HTH domain